MATRPFFLGGTMNPLHTARDLAVEDVNRLAESAKHLLGHPCFDPGDSRGEKLRKKLERIVETCFDWTEELEGGR